MGGATGGRNRVPAWTGIGLAIFGVGAAFYVESASLGAIGDVNGYNQFGFLGVVLMAAGLLFAGSAAAFVGNPVVFRSD